MSAICLRSIDNFSIITTAVHRRIWGDYKVQIQVKTPDGEVELGMNDPSHLNIIINALHQLLNDVNDDKLEAEQIRSRVINSNDDLTIIRKPLF